MHAGSPGVRAVRLGWPSRCFEPGTYRFTSVQDVHALAEAVVEVPGAEQVILRMVRAVEDDRLAADLHV